MTVCAVGAVLASEHSSWETTVREQQVAAATTGEAPLDLRAAYAILTLTENPLLKNMAYSSVGWDLEERQVSRTVSVSATPGTFVNGEFVTDGTADIPLVQQAVGRGLFDWTSPTVDQKVYRLAHRVFEGANAVVDEQLIGYLDFTDCVIAKASQAAVEAAALATVSHAVVLQQDEIRPWQPMAGGVVGCGIATGRSQTDGETTATTFRFVGSGTFSFDYELLGGELELVADGVTQTLSAAQEWRPYELAFDGYAEHEIVLRFVGDGRDGQAAVRAVRWQERREYARDASEFGEVRVDLREGVRKVSCSADLLPFAYSPTNWIGDVALAVPSASVTVVKLEGTEAEPLVDWTEIESSRKILVQTDKEGTVAWPGRQGAWKAIFEIRDEQGRVERSETAFFDMRGANGMALIIR